MSNKSNSISPNYFNSVYNINPSSIISNKTANKENKEESFFHEQDNNNVTPLKMPANQNMNESKELKEINKRLGYYINAVKDLTQNMKQNQPISSLNTSNWQNSSFGNNNLNYNSNNALLMSMKNLEKDLEVLKQLYEEELKLMRVEIEELTTAKNKYSLDNFNLELKLKDFIIKFEDIKKTNEELLDELNEAKSKNNRIEFELENIKLEAEKPMRENKQLKKDLEDLLAKINEKQAISDNEISYRQELELKFKELNDLSLFEKKLYEQEVDNLKSQLEISQTTINQLESKLNSKMSNDLNEDEDEFEKSYNDLRNENSLLKKENVQLEEENESLKKMCTNLESVIDNLEKIKKQLEEKIASKEQQKRFSNETTLTTQINSIKTKLDAEEVRLQQLSSNKPTLSAKFSLSSANLDQMNELNEDSAPQRAGNNYLFSRPKQQNGLGLSEQVNNVSQSGKRNMSAKTGDIPSNRISNTANTNPFIEQQKKQQKLETNLPPTSAQPQQSATQTPRNFNTLPQSASSAIQSPLLNKPKIDLNLDLNNKDYTIDLFNQFEKTTLFKREMSNNSSLSTIDNTITEASYTGNVKIHEVNKNGYYIRLLNVSNTYDEDLSNYTIQQMVSTMPVAIYRLPSSTKIAPGHTITIWARTDEVEQQPPHTFVWYEQDKWGTGPECTTILAKPNGQAVSWTTGCHKYGNIDYDEIIPVYSQKRNKTSAQLNRQKLSTQKIFTPTKHPHGSNSLKIGGGDMTPKSATTLTNDNGYNGHPPLNSPKISETSAFQKSFFSTTPTNNNSTNQKLKSAPNGVNGSVKNPTRPNTSFHVTSPKNVNYENNFDNEFTNNDFIYQENYCYIQKNQKQPPQDTYLMNKIK